MLSLLAYLLDFFLSYDTALSYYVIDDAPLLDLFPVARYTFVLLSLMVSLLDFFPCHTMHRNPILLSLLASLLDFFLSHNTPLSHYVISVGVSVGFFPVKRFTFIYLCYHCWCRCWIFSLSNDSPLSYICYHCWRHCWIFLLSNNSALSHYIIIAGPFPLRLHIPTQTPTHT